MGTAAVVFVFTVIALVVGAIVNGLHQRDVRSVGLETYLSRVRRRDRDRARAKEQNRARLRALELAGIDAMTGYQFEQYLMALLEHRGFKATHVGKAGDQGVDIVAELGPERYAVQTKCYKKPVANGAVQEVVTGKALYQCTRAIVVTNSTFTPGARELAEANSCVLVDRKVLAEWIIDFQRRQSSLWTSISEKT